MTRVLITNTLVAILAALLNAPAMAQVHYHDSGHPWKQRVSGGPDAEVPGWYYNLGITGMRAELVADEPKSLQNSARRSDPIGQREPLIWGAFREGRLDRPACLLGISSLESRDG
jgi:hypothetical protein